MVHRRNKNSAHRVRQAILYNARGCVDDVAFGIIRCLVSQDVAPQQIARQLNISLNSAKHWMSRCADQPPSSMSNRKAPANRKLSEKQKEIRLRRKAGKRYLCKKEVRADDKKRFVNFLTGSCRRTSRALKLEGKFTVGLSKSQVHRDSVAVGLACRVRRFAPQSHPDDPQTRERFAKKLQQLAKEKQLMYSDEKKFDTEDHGNRHQYVEEGERPEPRHRNQAAASVHVWGIIHEDPQLCKLIIHDDIDPDAPKRTRGRPRKDAPPREPEEKKRNVTADTYIRDCLEPTFGHMTAAKKREIIFMQDGAPCHRAAKTTQWLKQHNVPLLEGWPARSPDLNPIEKVWSILGKRVSDRGPLTRPELINFVKEEWKKLVDDRKTIPKLIAAVPTRCAEVARARGAYVN